LRFVVCFVHYLALPHPRGQRNNARFGLLTWATIRLDTDGYAQIGSMIRIVNIRKTSTVTHLKLDVNGDQSLYKPPPVEKFQSLIDETYYYITTNGKPINLTSPKTTTNGKTINLTSPTTTTTGKTINMTSSTTTTISKTS